MGRLGHPTRWRAATLATCVLTSTACGGVNPDDLFHPPDAAADETPTNTLADGNVDDAPSADGGVASPTDATDDVSLDGPEPGDASLASDRAEAAFEASLTDARAERASTEGGLADAFFDRSVADVTDADAALAVDAASEGSTAEASTSEAGTCDDGNPCTVDVRESNGACATRPVVCPVSDDCHLPATCSPANGTCSALAKAVGAVCATAQGGRCDVDSVCTPTFMVVRVGDGTPLVAARSAAVSVERRFLTHTADVVVEPGNPVIMPTAAVGNDLPFTLSGAGAEGALSLSGDGRYVTLAGYLAPPGTMAVRSTANRVVARINHENAVDTSTLLTVGLYSDNVRSATSLDGSQFWVGGSGNFDTSGIYYVGLGEYGGSAILQEPTDVRALHIFAHQLYASARGTLLAVGAGASSAADQITMPLLPGSSEAYSFALVDSDPAVPGPDAAYVADDREVEGGGGIAKWTRGPSGAWRLNATFSSGLSTGVRGLAAITRAGVTTVVATTGEASDNHIVTFTDDGTDHPVTLLVDAPRNTAFRGVAFAP